MMRVKYDQRENNDEKLLKRFVKNVGKYDRGERTNYARMSPRGGVNRRLTLFLIRGLRIAE